MKKRLRLMSFGGMLGALVVLLLVAEAKYAIAIFSLSALMLIASFEKSPSVKRSNGSNTAILGSAVILDTSESSDGGGFGHDSAGSSIDISVGID